jgi:serine/threonine protein phosphatase PrpC
MTNEQPMVTFKYFHDLSRPILNPNEKGADYIADYPHIKTVVATIAGKRRSQEDRFSAGSLIEFDGLSESQKQLVLAKTVDDLQHHLSLNKSIKQSGSTLCMTVICHQKLYTANVGDSVSYLITKNSNQTVSIERLNKHLHRISKNNVASLIDQGYDIKDDGQGFRIMDVRGTPRLNMFRAMGDNELTLSGLKHTPDIYSSEANLSGATQAWLLVASDGLTECLTEIDLQHYFQQQNTIELAELTHTLVTKAYFAGSTDNITVMITSLMNDQSTRYLSLFDGHGGSETADYLQQTIHSTLINNILAFA